MNFLYLTPMGGLGNQMFQICSLLSWGIDSGSIPKIHRNVLENCNYPDSPNVAKRTTYWDTFFASQRKHLVDVMESPRLRMFNIEWTVPHHDDYLLPLIQSKLETHSVELFCVYGNSYKYFAHNFHKICRELDIGTMKSEVRSMFAEDFFEDKVSIHFRFGDFIALKDCHVVLDVEYYKRAVRYVKQARGTDTLTALCFYEEKDAEIALEYVRELSSENVSFVKVSNATDWQDMLMMSLCRDHITANSTFSWWGAYLNERVDSRVACPSFQDYWVRPEFYKEREIDISKFDTDKDLFPPGWRVFKSL